MEMMNKSTSVAIQVKTYLSQLDNEGLNFDLDSHLAAPMLDAKYERMEIKDVIEENCQHLKPDQKKQLHALLSKYTKLFDGMLGLYPGKPMNVELEEGA